MNKKSTNINAILDNMIQLIDEEDLGTDEKETAIASVLIGNPAVSWAKFILTDDQPNENKQRVPFKEFDNIIKSGLFMPLKMAFGAEYFPKHKNTFPIGVITHLKKVENTIGEKLVNQIQALAALWSEERPEDIKFLKESMASKIPINVSWEIIFENSNINDGIEDLIDTSLKSAVVVKDPAYAGRTHFLAIAAIGSPAYLDKLSDDSFLYVKEEDNVKTKLFPYKDLDGNVDINAVNAALASLQTSPYSEEVKKEISKVADRAIREQQFNREEKEKLTKEAISEKETTLDEIKQELLNSKTKAADLETLLNTKEKEFKTINRELEDLRNFKLGIETENTNSEKLSTIKEKFKTVGIERPEDYFETNKAKLLSMGDDTLDFVIQDLISFSKKEGAGEDKSTDQSRYKLPPIPSEKSKEPTIKEIVEYLKTTKK